MVRVIFEGGGKVNLTLTIGRYKDEYFAIDVKDTDYNTMEDSLPEYLTEKLALLKLSTPSTSIEGVGFKNVYDNSIRWDSESDVDIRGFIFPREVFYVDINSVGFNQLVKDCKVRRSNWVK